jgi:hypothetical protein
MVRNLKTKYVMHKKDKEKGNIEVTQKKNLFWVHYLIIFLSNNLMTIILFLK